MKKFVLMAFFAWAISMVSTIGFAAGYDEEAPWPSMRRDYRNTGWAENVKPSELADRDQVPIWTFHTDGPIFSTPVVGADGTVYIGSADFVFYAIGPDGKLKWSYRTERLIDSAAAISDDGRVYIPGGDGFVYAMDIETGEPIWKFSPTNLESGVVPKVNWFEGNVTIGPDGTVLAPNDDFCLYGVSRDGQKMYESCTGGIVWSAIPTDDAGRHFFCSLDRACYGVDAGGDRLWKTSTWGVVSASPAIGDNGRVYVASFDGKLYALDPATGKKIWSFKTGDHVYASAALANGMIYIPSCDGSMYALQDAGDEPRLIWTYDTLDPIRSSPAVDGDGNIYFGNGNGEVFVLGPDGKRRWSINLTESDENDVNASIALGERAFYLAMQDGRVVQIPYDYCLEAGRTDPRCVVDHGEGLPDSGVSLFWVTPGGSSTSMEETVEGVMPGAVATLRLLAREGGDTRAAGVERGGLEVEVEPYFPHHVTVSLDHRFINIVPDGHVEPDREYAVRVKGRYREQGFTLLGHIWITSGKLLGEFEDEVKFKTSMPSAPEPEPGEPIVYTHMSFYQPTIFPSVAQIGMDDMNFLVVPTEEVAPDTWNAWVMVAIPDEQGKYNPEAGNRVNFGARVKYDNGMIIMEGKDVEFDHAGDRLGFSLFRGAGVIEEGDDDLKISINSLYAEGKSLSMAESFYEVPVFGTPCVGTLHVKKAEAPKAPEGISVKSLSIKGGKVVAEYENTSGLKTGEHNLGIMLIDAGTREPLTIDYGRATAQISDSEGNALRTEVELPWKYSLMKERVEALVFIDGARIASTNE